MPDTFMKKWLSLGFCCKNFVNNCLWLIWSYSLSRILYLYPSLLIFLPLCFPCELYPLRIMLLIPPISPYTPQWDMKKCNNWLTRVGICQLMEDHVANSTNLNLPAPMEYERCNNWLTRMGVFLLVILFVFLVVFTHGGLCIQFLQSHLTCCYRV